MSGEMSSTPAWRSLTASSRRGLSSLRDIKQSWQPAEEKTSPDDTRPGWREWAGKKIRWRNHNLEVSTSSDERISLFPGWAARRYRRVGSGELPEAFEVDVYVAGFASSHRTPENSSRSQRAFLRLAKGFAALPKLMADVTENALNKDPLESTTNTLSKSTEDLLATAHLPPRPDEISDDYDVRQLEEVFRQARRGDHSPADSSSSRAATPSPASGLSQQQHPITTAVAADLRKLHMNLEMRLLPFWASVLAGRTVRISLYAAPRLPQSSQTKDSPTVDIVQEAFTYEPVVFREVTTGVDGSFTGRFTVNWEELCQHPGALHIAFGDSFIEHDLLVCAELLPPLSPPSSASSASTDRSSRSARIQSERKEASYGTASMNSTIPPEDTQVPTSSVAIRMPLTHSPIRIISDIDDTVKRADILSGPRAVFHTVFAKELKDIVIPGMGEWYTDMWKRGVRFHYVSNGPFELLPVINEFFQVSHLPPGSIKLKSYSGRSLFNGLLSAPVNRKRVGIQEILDSFPESRFFLIGDSGEQDLEVYAEFAKERPEQILGVFIRYVGEGEMIADPTGWTSLGTNASYAPSLGSEAAIPCTTPMAGPSSAPRTRTLSGILTTLPKPKSLSLSINIPSSRTPPGSRPTTPVATSVSGGGYFSSAMPVSAEPHATYQSSSGSSTSYQSGGYPSVPGYPPQPSSAGMSRTPASSGVSAISIPSTNSAYARLSEPERKRAELQLRVYRARTQMPGHIPLRIFRTPAECVEAEGILGREGKGRDEERT